MSNLSYENYINSIRLSKPNNYFKGAQLHHILPRCMGGTDNSDNLIYLTYEEHLEAHRILMLENEGNYPLYYKLALAYNRMALMCKTNIDYETVRKDLSNAVKGLWGDPEYRDLMVEIARSTPRNQKLSNSLKEYFSSEENRKKTSECTSRGLIEYYKIPGNLEKHREAVTKANNRPETVKIISVNTKEALKRPEVIRNMSESRLGTVWYNDGVRNYRTKDPDKIKLYESLNYKRGKIRVNKNKRDSSINSEYSVREEGDNK